MKQMSNEYIRSSAEEESSAYRNTNEATGPNLTLVRERFVIWPKHDTRIERVGRDVLDLPTDRECTARGGEKGVMGRRLLAQDIRVIGGGEGRRSWDLGSRVGESGGRDGRTGGGGRRPLRATAYAGEIAPESRMRHGEEDETWRIFIPKIMSGTFRRGTTDQV
jgi:hypothetical protein